MTIGVDELRLHDEPDAVPRARHFATGAARSLGYPELADDVELVVSELVTNAMLHGRPPVVLRLLLAAEGLRIEVGDQQASTPVRAAPGADGMTGRGLALVEALTTRWGLDRQPGGGKVVWCLVAPDGPDDPVADPAGTAPPASAAGVRNGTAPAEQVAGTAVPEDGQERHLVRLGDVPTALLLDAKRHMDNVVREFTLAAGGAQSGQAEQVPPGLARLVATVVSGFAEARDSIKRQALAAARAGAERTELVLHLPLSAATAGEDYLAALDQVDTYSAAARLLTLATPPEHQVFRRWYVESLIHQLRAAAAGEPPPERETFERRLLRELATVTASNRALERAARRLTRLQGVLAGLVSAEDVGEVADIVVGHAAEALGAATAVLCRVGEPEGDGSPSLHIVRSRGLDETAIAALEAAVRGGELPAARALRGVRPVVVPEPDLPDAPAGPEISVPLQARGQSLGILTLGFPPGHPVDDAEVEFLVSVADACAQALDRTSALQAADRLTQRIGFLADASAVLAESLDYRQTLRTVARLVVPQVADWCGVYLQEGDSLVPVAIEHPDQARIAFAEELLHRYPTDPRRRSGLPEVVRTGTPELVERIDDELLDRTVPDGHQRGLIRELGLRSALTVPLTGRSGTFGAIALFQAGSGRRYTADDVPFAADLARRAALAVENARAYQEQSGRLAAVQRVAEAAQHAILAPVPERAGPLRLSAAYVSATEDALVGGDLYEVVDRGTGVRLLIGDVRGKGLDAVRLATVVLGEFRAAAADHDDLTEVARRMDARVARYLGDEDFVTALLVDVRADGGCDLVSCGHPPALLARAGTLTELSGPASVPLGLGAEPQPLRVQLRPGDRLLLYTDGLIEARDSTGRFADVPALLGGLLSAPLGEVLADLLERLRGAVGELGDDLALLAAEFAPEHG